MAAGTPLTRLTLGAASVADDLGYVALSDLARALGDIPADFRVRCPLYPNTGADHTCPRADLTPLSGAIPGEVTTPPCSDARPCRRQKRTSR